MKKFLFVISTILVSIVLVTACSTSPGTSGSSSSSSGISFDTNFFLPDNWSAGSGWTLFWSDEFTSTSLNTNNWKRLVMPNPYNNEWAGYTDSPGNSFIISESNNGFLVIKADYNGQGIAKGNYTSARLITYPKKFFFGGKIAARIRIPSGQGIWPAFWMLGKGYGAQGEGSIAWPTCGEVDILENLGKNVNSEDQKDHSAIHGPGYDFSGTYTISTGKLADRFHVYEMVWSNNNISFYLDSTNYFNVSTNLLDTNDVWVFNSPMYIILNLAVGGNWPGFPDVTTEFPSYMFVDWVKVYTNETSTCTNTPINVSFPFNEAVHTGYTGFDSDGGSTVTYGWDGGRPNAYYLTNLAFEGSYAIAVEYPGSGGGGIYFMVSNTSGADVSSCTNLVFALKLPSAMNLEIKPESPGGIPTTGVQLTDYTPVSNYNGFDQYVIPVQDLKILSNQLKIPLGVWKISGAGGTLIIDDIYYQ